MDDRLVYYKIKTPRGSGKGWNMESIVDEINKIHLELQGIETSRNEMIKILENEELKISYLKGKVEGMIHVLGMKR